ncbi:double-stranded RNA-specific editase Adar isoform X2 [Anopheles funestus]|uniref:double-stranded RNA-specific editase Adar isoform X2 n=1 Tax=Anopheles funestus TaxID=62324 RepID=UPI0020C623C9|nr:double-stranded RNA-specific editase Adar isoform X2 [Anopheles funestus]
MNTSATTNTNNKINISNNNAINDKNNTSCPSSAMLNSTPRRGTKRKIATVGNGISTAIRKRRKLQNASKSGESRLEQVPQTKNTVAVLNELKRNLVYKVESQTGPVHAPLFTISVVVDGQKFVGTGPSKKLARVAAAASALRSFIQFKDGATLTPIEPLQNVDFTSDDPMIENSIFPLSDTVAGMQEKIVSVGGKSVPDNNTVNSLHSINNNSNHNNNSGKSPYGNSIGNSIKPIANRQCDFSGNNTTVHANNTNSKGAAVPSNGSNWQRKEAIATGSVHSITDSERQPPVEKPTTGATAAAAAAAASSLPNVNSSVTVRTAPAAASSIVTNKLKVSSGTTLRNSGNVTTGHHPKPQPEKGPVMLLHELFTDAHFECVSSDGLQHSKFTVVVTVHDNQRFEGTGPSKKMAKNAAAKAALASICNISFSPLQQSKFGLISAGTSNGSIGGPSGAALNGDNSFTQNKNFELPQTFADAVGKLVIEKFNEVMKGSDVYSRRKVLAGFVMTHGYDVKTARVISLATGTKCVSGEHMSVTGSVINDSHAEIIARRGLMDFFYSQLDLLCQQTAAAMQQLDGTGSTASVHDTVAGNETEPGASDRQARQEIIFNKPGDGSTLYTLKEGIYFHLYINTAPCGDARVFSPHENDSMDVDKHPNRKARGQLRTKVESGEGTIPVKSSDGIQTWDGVLQGQRLLTMSCSDKISRWNVLGLQGSLLASIIEPIYLHSIVLGSLLHPAHMYRAICGRIESAIQGLPPPYRLNKPKLALMTSAESRNQTKPPNFSINWITNGTEVEIVNSFTGKLINNNTNTNKMSRLSKQSFYQRYSTVIARLPGIPCRDVKPTYFETKTSVAEYQQAKRELFAAFSKEDLGEWLKKPIEQDQFTLIVAKDSEQPPYANQTQTVPMPNDANAATVGNVSSIGNSSK